jgi:hypothetical protein
VVSYIIYYLQVTCYFVHSVINKTQQTEGCNFINVLIVRLYVTAGILFILDESHFKTKHTVKIP